MRILHIYKDYFPVLGGIENHIRQLAEAQVRRGHEVTVLAAAPGRRDIRKHSNGVELDLAGRWGTLASTPISPGLFYRAARRQADLAHLHFPHPPGEMANLLSRPARRTIITYHTDIIRQRTLLFLYRPLLRRMLQRADRILATSPAYIETSPYLRPVRDRCRAAPLGVDAGRFEGIPEGRAAIIRARHAIPPEAGLALFVGRLRYYKALDVLLSALTGVADARLLIVGSGPMAAEWETLAGELGLAGRVVFAGEAAEAELPAYYRAADVFILPSDSRAEAFGMVLLEAMAAGRPVISTELGTGTSWVNQHGVTGLVVPPRRPSDLAAAIRTLLADPDRRREMGAAGRERVRRLFTLTAMEEAVESIYQELNPGNRS